MQLQIDKLGKVSITVEEGYWDITKDYDKLTIVEKEGTFGTFISRKPVPAGTVLTDRKYWIPFSSLKEEIILNFNKWVSDYGALLGSQAETLNAIQEAINSIYSHLPQGVIFKGNIDSVRAGFESEIILEGKTTNEEDAKFVLYKNNEEIYRQEEGNSFNISDTVNGDTEYKLVTIQNGYKYISTWNVAIALPLYAGGGQTYQDAIGDDKIVKVSNDISGIYSIVIDKDGDYIFFVAPKGYLIKSIKMNGLDVPIKSTKEVYLGTEYIIYQSDYQYKTGTYPIQINDYTGLNEDDFLGILNSLGDTASAVDVANLKERIDNLPVNELIDKEYAPAKFSGMGRIYLRKNIKNGKNILEQNMMLKENTIYIIQYDFDLNGKEISIPENCVLQFEGGSLRNGNIIGSNTIIVADPVSIFYDISIKGTFISNTNKYYCEWFDLDVEKCLLAFEKVDFVGKYTFDKNIFIEEDINPIINFHQGSIVTVTDTFNDEYLFKFHISGYVGGNPLYDSLGVKFIGFGGSIYLNKRCGFAYINRNPNSISGCASSSFENINVKGAGIGDRKFIIPVFNQSNVPSDCSSIITTYAASVLRNVSVSTDRQDKQPYVGINLQGADNKLNRVTIVINNIGLAIGGGSMVNECHVWGAPKCAFYVIGETSFWGCYGDWARINYHYIQNNVNINITDHSFIGSPDIDSPFNASIFIQCVSNSVRGHANLINYTASATIIPFNCIINYYKGSIPAFLNLDIQNTLNKTNEITRNNSGGYFLPKDKWVKITTVWKDWPYAVLLSISRPQNNVPHLIGYIAIDKYTFLGERTNNGILLKKEQIGGSAYQNIYIKNTTSTNCLIDIISSGFTLKSYNTNIVDDSFVEHFADIQYMSVTNTIFGTENSRPIFTSKDKGIQYFDTTLNKPIWWTGTKWVDSTGADV